MALTPEQTDRITKDIVECLGCTETQAADPKSTFADLGADSLDCVEMVMRFEEDHNIEILDEESENVTTVADLHALLDGKFNG